MSDGNHDCDMSRKKVMMVVLFALVVIGAGVSLTAWQRLKESYEFGRQHFVMTYGGTNYVVQIGNITVGKTETGYALIVFMRLENPNEYQLVLNRDWFTLMDQGKDHYQPSTTGTHVELISLPPHGVLENETLSYTVPDGSFAGSVALLIGHQHWVTLKDPQPFREQLRPGEFRSYRRRHW